MRLLTRLTWFFYPTYPTLADHLTNYLILLFIIMLQGDLRSQDCSHDTIPPELKCKQDVIYRYGLCGIEQIYASAFVISATDNCSMVTITFDEEGKKCREESHILWMDPNWPNGQITIYARDTSGNVSKCIAQWTAIPLQQTKTITCKLITGFYEENDKIQLKIRTNDNVIYNASLIKQWSDYLDYQVTIDGNQSIQTLIVEALDKPFVHEYITTSDLFATLRQIIGIDTYSSPVNYISEDTDCNGEINLMDVYKTRKYIEGIISTDSCLGKPVLYFIDEKGNILGNEIPYKENSTEPLSIAFNQIGDINRNLPQYNKPLPNKITRFSGEPLVWNTPGLSCVKAQKYAVTFTLSDSIDLFGLQCNFAFDSNLIQINNLNTNFTSKYHSILPGEARIAWINISNPSFINAYPEVTIDFTAKEDFVLNNALFTSHQTISNFGITRNGIARPVEIVLTSLTKNEDKDQIQNYIRITTNPDNHQSILSGKISSDNEVELLVYSVSGCMINRQKIHPSEGRVFASFMIDEPGIYYAIVYSTGIKPLVRPFIIAH